MRQLPSQKGFRGRGLESASRWEAFALQEEESAWKCMEVRDGS